MRDSVTKLQALADEQNERPHLASEPGLRRLLASRWFQIGLSLSIAAICSWLLSRLVDLREALQLFRRSQPEYIVLALIFYAASYMLRVIRIQRLHPQQRFPIIGLWRVVALHNLLNYLLPLRSGDVSLIYLLKRRLGISAGTGAGIWLLIRLLDMVFAMLFLAGAVAYYVAQGGWGGDRLILSMVVTASIAMLAGLLLLPRLWSFLERTAVRLRPAMPVLRRPTADRLYAKAVEVGEVLRSSQRGRMLAELALTSAAIWATFFGVFWSILRATGLPNFTLPEIVIGSSGAVIANFLPINSFASIGTLEAGWATGFSLLGVSQSDAIISGVVMHVWVIGFAVGLAVVALCADSVARRVARAHRSAEK
jgi:uncharacterized membrane protein YbhN (UPF0104 family)